jgi:alkylated DNA repair protein (DNA oxidative demethylase)
MFMGIGLFSSESLPQERFDFAPGVVLLRRFAAQREAELLAAIEVVTALSPFRQMVMPTGQTMSVAMTNCGAVGWVSDRERGYRYQDTDPLSGRPWPEIPALLRDLASNAAAEAGFAGFVPDVSLVNLYLPGNKLHMHRDNDERDFNSPIVSVSLGLPAVFMFGGLKRTDPYQSVRLDSGDVFVWGGATRLAFHGIKALKDGEHPLTGRCRYNFTLRKAL